MITLGRQVGMTMNLPQPCSLPRFCQIWWVTPPSATPDVGPQLFIWMGVTPLILRTDYPSLLLPFTVSVPHLYCNPCCSSCYSRGLLLFWWWCEQMEMVNRRDDMVDGLH